MKALSIKQPYAEFIRRRMKTIETRTWQTQYRGDILICAGLKPADNFDLSEYDLKYGHAIAVAELVNITHFLKEHEEQAQCDYYPNAFAWHLQNVRLIEPFKQKGQLGLFNVNDSLIKWKNYQRISFQNGGQMVANF